MIDKTILHRILWTDRVYRPMLYIAIDWLINDRIDNLRFVLSVLVRFVSIFMVYVYTCRL